MRPPEPSRTASKGKVGGYRVYRRNADGTWPTTWLAQTPRSQTSYTDGGLTNGTANTYRASSAVGWSIAFHLPEPTSLPKLSQLGAAQAEL